MPDERKRTRTALIVDDDASWQRQYANVLVQRRFKTIGAESLAEAIEQIKRRRFDLAIVDMNLTLGVPQNEGFAVLDEITRRSEDTAIIVSTGYPDLDLAIEGYEKYKIDKFYKKRDWVPNEFGDMAESVISNRSGFKLKQILSKQFRANKLSDFWYTYKLALDTLLDDVGVDAEPIAGESLSRVSTWETVDGEIMQVSGWSRGFGASVVFRVGTVEGMTAEYKSYTEYESVISKLSRPLRVLNSLYQSLWIGVLPIELVGASFGQTRVLSELFHSGQHQRFLEGLRDLLTAGCSDLFNSYEGIHLNIKPSLVFAKHLAELRQRRETRLEKEKEQIRQAIEQLNEGERVAEEYQMNINEEEKRKDLMSLGFPVRQGDLVDAITLLSGWQEEVSTTQTLISHQLSVSNTFIDNNNHAWPIYGGSFGIDSTSIELAGLETDIKFLLLPPSPITTYSALEKRLDSSDNSIEILDDSTRTALEAIRLVRAFAQQWQPDDRLYRFVLALQASRVIETTNILDRREGARFSAAWHADKIFK